MKKHFISMFFTTILTTFLLVGCGNKQLQDGTYTATDKNYDAHGWKASVTITVSSNKIINVKFDYIAEDGTTKSGNADYAEKMASSTHLTPDEYITQYTEQLLNFQNTENIDVVTGATTSYNDFKTLANAAINAAKAGNTNTAEVQLNK